LLYDVFTERHLELLAKVTLTTAWMMAYSYVTETFVAWYSGDAFERYTYLVQRPFGGYAAVYWTMMAFNLVAPQLFWFRRMRRSRLALAGVSILVLIGMWEERFVIVAGSLHQDFLPSAWGFLVPTLV